MTSVDIERSFRERVCAEIALLPEGKDRFIVVTPFQFDDGDHLHIVLRNLSSGWVLSDEGHTLMHLSYRIDEKQFLTGTRQKIISNALSVYGIDDRDGELRTVVTDNDFGEALFSFVQGLMKITDISFLSRERVRSTFLEDFRALISSAVPDPRRKFDWYDPTHDQNGHYQVDCRVNGMATPLMVFALPSDERTQTATITIHTFEKWALPFDSMAIFEDQEQIGRKVLARFTDVCGKTFSSLTGNTDRIRSFLGSHLQS